MVRRDDDERPYCECGNCDATGRKNGREVRLPMDAWAVAGYGDTDRIAVHLTHAHRYEGPDYILERHRGWVAVAMSDTAREGDLTL